MKRKRTQRARRVKRLLVGIMLFAIVGSALWMLNIEERDEVRASVLPSNDRIAFLVRYSNGDAARIEIPLSALREGREGHVAKVIAGEMQRAGEIPQGEVDFVTGIPATR